MLKKIVMTIVTTVVMSNTALAIQVGDGNTHGGTTTHENAGSVTYNDNSSRTTEIRTTYEAGSAGKMTTVNNNQSSKTEQTIKNVVPINLTNLHSSGTYTCSGSVTGGVSAPGIAISGGSTTTDDNCVMLLRVDKLTQLGLTDAAVALMIAEDEKLARAFYYAYPKMVEEFSPVVYLEMQMIEAAALIKAKKKHKKTDGGKKVKKCAFNCN